MTQAIAQQDYHEFLAHLKASIRQHQYQALRAVNRQLTRPEQIAERLSVWFATDFNHKSDT